MQNIIKLITVFLLVFILGIFYLSLNRSSNYDTKFLVGNKIADINKFNNLFRNFLNFLIQKRRFFFIVRILKSFIEICSKKRGELTAELKSAKKLSSDEIKKITFELNSNDFKYWNPDLKNWYLQPGQFEIQIGSSSADIHLSQTIAWQ